MTTPLERAVQAADSRRPPKRASVPDPAPELQGSAWTRRCIELRGDAVAEFHQDDREAWLQNRAGGVGASDVPTILGVSKFRDATRANLLKQKAGLLKRPDLAQTSDKVRFGQLCEDAILQLYRERTNRRAEPCGWAFRSRDVEYLTCTPDGLEFTSRGLGLVELKFVSSGASHDWVKGQKGPETYWWQVQHQLLVTGMPYGRLVGMVDGELHHLLVEPDKRAFDRILTETESFWRELQQLLPT